jgi:hypothetical protein
MKVLDFTSRTQLLPGKIDYIASIDDGSFKLLRRFVPLGQIRKGENLKGVLPSFNIPPCRRRHTIRSWQILSAKPRGDRQGPMTEYLCHIAFVIPDELYHPPFAKSCDQLLLNSVAEPMNRVRQSSQPTLPS